LDGRPGPVALPAIALGLAFTALIGRFQDRGEIVEDMVGLGRRATARRQLREAHADDGARVEPEQLPGPPVRGLDLALAADKQDAVGRRVEDLRQADALRRRFLVEPGVLARVSP